MSVVQVWHMGVRMHKHPVFVVMAVRLNAPTFFVFMLMVDVVTVRVLVTEAIVNVFMHVSLP